MVLIFAIIILYLINFYIEILMSEEEHKNKKK
jgi:hypothetical protein